VTPHLREEELERVELARSLGLKPCVVELEGLVLGRLGLLCGLVPVLDQLVEVVALQDGRDRYSFLSCVVRSERLQDQWSSSGGRSGSTC